MIVFSRDLARKFRAVAKKCVTSWRLSPPPPVVCRSADGTLTITAQLEEVRLGVSVPDSENRNETVIVPMDVFEAVEGVGNEFVEVEVTNGTRGIASWTHRGVPRSLPFEASKLVGSHEPLPSPETWAPMPKHLLAALHECGRTAARESGRFALDRVQLRGESGQVIGTDSKTALIASRFSFPFSDDVLVPAVPVFGCREWGPVSDVRLGRVEGYLVVGVDAWALWLPIDSIGRYPDVASVMPRSVNPTVVGIDEGDAQALQDRLRDEPTNPDDPAAVTLDLDGTTVVRAKGSGCVVEVQLSRSPVAGPPTRCVLVREQLCRALGLGCSTLRVFGSGKPVVFEGDDRLYLSVPLEDRLAIPPTKTAHAVRTEPISAPHTPIHSQRRNAMKSLESNGHTGNNHAGNGRSDLLPSSESGPDLLVEAEGLRTALSEATLRLNRLMTVLKSRKKEERALASVWSSLKSLRLDK